jgi:hypothetical protein
LGGRDTERSGRPIAIIGGIAPAQVKTRQQDSEQAKRDGDKADA